MKYQIGMFDLPQAKPKKHIKLLLGGSPCTHWSIAQSKNRETEASGIGWELFKNYLYAAEKFNPDYFLYENNKSAAQPIKDQISRELGVKLQYINSALVSAQNRRRFYAHNIPCVPQPDDRGILLKDILDSGIAWQEKGYALSESITKTEENSLKKLVQKSGLYACPIGPKYSYLSEKMIDYAYKSGTKNFQCKEKIMPNKSLPLTTKHNKRAGTTNYIPQNINEINCELNCEGKGYPVYEVKNNLITIKGKTYPIKLPDGFYIIRKLSVNECRRLQTIPDWYQMPCSNSQNYKMLGNGWTVEVIKHILGFIPNISDCTVEVLSMYDGMGCGAITLTELGCKIEKYVSYEIDKYAIQTTQTNFPQTEQRGDAFQVRESGWRF